MIDGSVAEDALLASGSVIVAPGARIGRDLWLGAGTATLRGPIAGDVMGGAGNLTMSGPVGGDVQARVDRLNLADGATIAGNLAYTSPLPAAISNGARVQGSVQYTEPTDTNAQHGPLGEFGEVFAAWLRALIGFLALGLALVMLFPNFSGHAIRGLARRPLPTLGIGAGVLIGMPVAALLLVVVGIFVGGWWLGLLTLAVYLLALAVSIPIAGLFVGRWLVDRVGLASWHRIWTLLLGLVLLLVASFVPWVGLVVVPLAVLAGLGALVGAVLGARGSEAVAEAAIGWI